MPSWSRTCTRQRTGIGYDVVLSTVTRTRDERRATETLLDSRCEALMLLGPDAPAARLAALDRQLPVVAVGRRIGRPNLDIVRVADDLGTAEAVEHLASSAIARSPMWTVAAARSRPIAGGAMPRRCAGTVSARSCWCSPATIPRRPVSRAGRNLLDSDELPTAVATFNDSLAVGLLDTLLRAGITRAGGDLGAGYDDSPLARLAHVDLTSVRQDTRAAHRARRRRTGRAARRRPQRAPGGRAGPEVDRPRQHRTAPGKPLARRAVAYRGRGDNPAAR